LEKKKDYRAIKMEKLDIYNKSMGKNSLEETYILHHVLPSWLEIVGGAW
jgi:hypothetical protein